MRTRNIPPDDKRHGTDNAYVNLRCRCPDCTKAHSAECRRQRWSRVHRLVADPTLVPHGRVSTYNNWGCTCLPCLDAKNAYTRQRRAARRGRAA